MLKIYTSFMGISQPVLKAFLNKRAAAGKEDPKRLDERMGKPRKNRPSGKLLWIHAASVGEAQSALILIEKILQKMPEMHILLTTGTVTSAKLMLQKLPTGVIHQYYPLDHPKWVTRFLDHWKPDLVYWMESELWPVMLSNIQKRSIPAAIINARLSKKSLKRWKMLPKNIRYLLSTFSVCITQTEEDTQNFRALGAKNVMTGDNIKYSATPLLYDKTHYARLKQAIGIRPVWVYASTHDGEEDLACRIHKRLRKEATDLLTIIIPRHPERRDAIKTVVNKHSLPLCMRSSTHKLPDKNDEIYIADTLGELGLFYKLSPIACIGRSFSNDGGGGHNPIEAAQLGCAILHGPNVQNLQEIYDLFNTVGAAIRVTSEKDLQDRLSKLFADPEGLSILQHKASALAAKKNDVINTILETLLPMIEQEDISKKCA